MKIWMATVAMVGVLTSFNAVGATFDGHECEDDCSGHQAGYDWAQQNEIDDESACTTSSNSFNEGCISFVEGGAGTIDDDDDDE